MAKVTFYASGSKVHQVHESRADESLLDLALRVGLSMQNDCCGGCSCGTCHVLVKTGAENLSSQDAGERRVLRTVDSAQPVSRLACQCQITGDVTVEIANPLNS